jgi:2-amino-4-hydroxy-6-hydroxymethyldihydropteridine diphosphokinase
MSKIAYIGLGANLGDRAGALRRAAGLLAHHLGPLRGSALYQTEPRLDEDQPAFLNAAVSAPCALEPLALLALLQRVERQLGRVRDPSRPKGPRVVDLDLLVLGDTLWHDEALVLPHPGLHLRRFVLAPLCELAPDLTPPGLGATVEALLARCPDQGWVVRTQERIIQEDQA